MKQQIQKDGPSNGVAEKGSRMTPDDPAAAAATSTHRQNGHHNWVAVFAHRWPSWLAILLAALNAGDPGSVGGLSEALLLFALGYLAAAVIRRRQATWVIAIIGVGGLAGLRLQGWVEPSVVVRRVVRRFRSA